MGQPDAIEMVHGVDEVPESDVETLLEEEIDRRASLEPSIYEIQYTVEDWAEVSIDTDSWTFRFRDTDRDRGHGGATKTYTGVPFSYGDFATKVENQQLADTVHYEDLNCGGSVDGIVLQDETDNRVLVEHGEPEPAPQRQLSSWEETAASTVYDEAKTFFDRERREDEAQFCDEGCYDLDIEEVVDDIYDLASGTGEADRLAALFSEIARRPSDSRESTAFTYDGPLKEGVIEIEAVVRAGDEDAKQRYDEQVGDELRKWGSGSNFRVYGRVVEEDIMNWEDDVFSDDGSYCVPDTEQSYEEPTDAFKDEARRWMREEHGSYWRRS